MYAGSDQQTVRHTWRPDTQRGLQLVTERKDSRAKGGWVLWSKVYVAAFENALSKMAKKKAHEVMHAKRETAAYSEGHQRYARHLRLHGGEHAQT